MHNLPSAKSRQKCNVQVNVPSMSKIYQQDFSKATALKPSVKGAMCRSFCKAPNTTISKELAKKRSA